MMFGTELLLAAALLGPAQQPQKTGDSEMRYGTSVARDKSAVYEDIEIMRQLLARKLGGFAAADVRPLYGPQTSAAGSHNGQPQASADFAVNNFLQAVNPYVNATGEATHLANSLDRSFPRTAFVEGVYLDRIGAVFTVILPPHGDPRPNPAKPAPSPAGDEWENTRKELRGEKSDPTSAPATQPPTVGDVILRVLAENGKHFRGLGGDERLTVVVTFRGGSNQPHSPWLNYPPVKTQAPVQNPTTFTLSGGGTVTLGGGSSANDLELLADLHLKQQQYDQALETVGKAIAQVSKEASDAVLTKGQGQRLASLYSRKAQALLAMGKVGEARDALDKATKLSGETTGANVALANKSKPESMSLPAKLIISAPKGLFDAVGSDKIDYEAFRQQVSVEYLTFGEEKPKSKQ
jgi:tetratricopeptide (TPR) repeat protein